MCSNATYSNFNRNLCCSHPRVICQVRKSLESPKGFHIEKVAINVLKVHLWNISL